MQQRAERTKTRIIQGIHADRVRGGEKQGGGIHKAGGGLTSVSFGHLVARAFSR